MKVINIADERNRNTRVSLANKRRAAFTYYTDQEGHGVESQRVIKSTLQTDLKSLTKNFSLEELSQQLIDGDPEIDTELVGKRVTGTSRLFLTVDNEPANGVQTKELRFDTEGELTEEKDFAIVEANINSEAPLKWSGRLIPKTECYTKFVFTNAMQLQHVDGLTFDFLYTMAKKLDEANSLLFLGAGKKSSEPLILSRNGKQYRAFLEGRIKDKKYLLVLHLTNLELKPIEAKEGK